MMVKDPRTKLVINKDESHYEVLKLRRFQRKQAKLLQDQISSVTQELAFLKSKFEELNREQNV